MRTATLSLFALLALAQACTDDPSTGPADDGIMVDLDRPRGERCEDMYLCAQQHCQAEIFESIGCFVDANPDCTDENSAASSCIVGNDCNATTCDGVDFDCGDDELEIWNLAQLSVYGAEGAVAECMALE